MTTSSIEVLEASISKIRSLYGETFDLMVCVNGEIPKLSLGADVAIYEQSADDLTQYGCPAPIGPIWKITPPAIRPGSHELTLDNDLILLRRSKIIEKFLESDTISVMAESNTFPRVYGRFASFKDQYPLMVNSGIIGVPPSLNINNLLQQYVTLVDFNDGLSCPMTGGIWIHEDIQGLMGMMLHENSTLMTFRLTDIPIFHADDEPNGDLSGIDGIHFVGINRDNHKQWLAWRSRLTSSSA